LRRTREYELHEEHWKDTYELAVLLRCSAHCHSIK